MLTKEKIQEVLRKTRELHKEHKGFNQKSVSYKIGMTPATFSKYFNKTPPNLVIAIKMLNFLSIEIKDFKVRDNEEIKEILKKALKNKGITKSFLADSIGVSRGTPSFYFLKNSRNLVRVINLLYFLDIEVKDFYVS